MRQSFQREFPTARILKWEKNGDYLKATFVFNENRTEAWFSNEGELQGTIRCLLYDQLPFAVMRGIESRFPSAGIIDILEITNSNGTSYRITAESKKGKFLLIATSGGEVIKAGKIKM